VNLAAGMAVYLVGDAWRRRVLRIGSGRARLLVAALALATIPLGVAFGPVAQIAACVVLAQPLWMLERKRDESMVTTEKSGKANPFRNRHRGPERRLPGRALKRLVSFPRPDRW
jgi:hypothetical protein